jgi:hypothetical protein
MGVTLNYLYFFFQQLMVDNLESPLHTIFKASKVSSNLKRTYFGLFLWNSY